MKSPLTALRLALALASAASVAVVTGCAPSAPAATPTPTPVVTTAAPAPEPSLTPTMSPAASAIILSTTGFAIVDETGASMFDYVWADDVAPAVTALTEAFGSPAVREEDPGDGTHFGPSVVYAWDDFVFIDREPSGRDRSTSSWPAEVFFQGPGVGGLDLQTVDGARVGMTAAEVESIPPQLIQQGFSGGYVYLFDALDPAALEAGSDSQITYVATDPAGEFIEQIRAPQSAVGRL